MKRHLGRALAPIDDNIMTGGGGGGSVDDFVSPVPTIRPITSTPVSVVTPPSSGSSDTSVSQAAPTPIPAKLAPVINNTLIAVNDNPIGPGIVQGSPKVQANVGQSSVPSSTVSTLVSTAPASLTSAAQNLVQAAQSIDPKKAIMVVGGVVLVSGILYAVTRKKKTTT